MRKIMDNQAYVFSDLVRSFFAKSKSVRAPGLGEFWWIWVGLILLFAVSSVIAPGTMTRGSILAMLPFAGILAIVATGQTLVIQQRGLDMSAIGMVSLAGVVMARTGFGFDSIVLAVILTVCVGMIVGIVNGTLVSRFAITPLVATLAVNALLIGGVRSLTGNVPVNVPVIMQTVSHAQLVGLPANVLFAFVFVVTAWVITRKTAIGRRFVAVGVNPRAAEAAGVRVLQYRIGAYVASAVCFSAAGMLLAGFIGSASQTSGNDYLLPAIAAVVVGGTPFTGGKGSVIASAVAALFMAQLGQLVLALGAGPAVQLLVQACAILLATTVRHLPTAVKTFRKKS
ncbi:ribose ABC transporter permease [Paraburkholderia phytofirmans OLGA172]|uniref:Ribose ABC transporter permease n=1 Tax=Paraburkholderia phytofirmans OLGA172 TaxID=1417228 RepID=A0A160FKR5_9BURK|nr:ribose ABC transporter permease [Paraburkholderia phytofirmans OLGA172]